MWNYNYSQSNELAHFGVPGMKWGRRKARQFVTWNKEAGKLIKNNYAHPILTSKANRESLKADTLGGRLRRSLVYQNTKDLKDVNRRVDIKLAEKKAKKALKKMEKDRINDVKTKYRQEYMAGKSKVGKIFAGVTNADKIYADVMYDVNGKK